MSTRHCHVFPQNHSIFILEHYFFSKICYVIKFQIIRAASLQSQPTLSAGNPREALKAASSNIYAVEFMQLLSMQPQQSELHAAFISEACVQFQLSANHNLNGIILSAEPVGRVRGKIVQTSSSSSSTAFFVAMFNDSTLHRTLSSFAFKDGNFPQIHCCKSRL